jgi:hypothetical protein
MNIETGRALGMQLLDQALLDALQAKEVDPNDAFLYAKDKKKDTVGEPQGFIFQWCSWLTSPWTPERPSPHAE